MVKTRTLLLLSVGVALLILVAGGVLLFQLSTQQSTTAPTELGRSVAVGDARITVFSAMTSDGVLSVDVEVGGVDDLDGIDGFQLVTGDQVLAPIAAPAEGRCESITVTAQRCTVDFDVTASESPNRVLVVRRGEEQSTWRLA